MVFKRVFGDIRGDGKVEFIASVAEGSVYKYPSLSIYDVNEGLPSIAGKRPGRGSYWKISWFG